MTEIIVARPVIPAIFAFHDIAAPLPLSQPPRPPQMKSASAPCSGGLLFQWVWLDLIGGIGFIS